MTEGAQHLPGQAQLTQLPGGEGGARLYNQVSESSESDSFIQASVYLVLQLQQTSVSPSLPRQRPVTLLPPSTWGGPAQA